VGVVVSLVLRKRNIFISYRHDQAAGIAGRLSDHLSRHFGEDHVFMDVASILPGSDFSLKIISAVSKCGVMLVLIGPNWLRAASITRRKRIDKSDDWVRLEIETALQQGIWIVPVLIDGADIPKTGDLPQSLRPLTRRHAFRLSNSGFRDEVERLIRAVEQGYEVPQEEWQLSLQSATDSKATFRLSSDSREHRITVGLTNRGMSVIGVDGQSVATGFTSAGIIGREIPLETLSREFGPVATIKIEILNPATTYARKAPAAFRVILQIDDQVLRYETEKYDRSLERQSRNQLRVQRTSGRIQRTSGRLQRTSGTVIHYLESDEFKEALSRALVDSLVRSYKDLSKNEALKSAIKESLKDALKRSRR